MTKSEGTYLLDVNVLVALTNASHVHHAASHRWLDSVPSWATTPLTESALIHLLLNRAVTGRDVSPADALRLLRQLRRQPRATFIPDSSTLAEPVVELSGMAGTGQVTDLHLVNLAAPNGAVLATFDGRIPQWLASDDREHVLVLGA